MVLLFNSEDVAASRTAVWSEIPQLGKHSHGYSLEDVWTGKDLGCVHKEYTVKLEAHDVAVLKVTGTC